MTPADEDNDVTAMKTLAQLARELAEGTTTSRKLTETALDRIADSSGEGSRAFIQVFADTARAAADASDILRTAGVVRSPLDGIPVSVKDLCDIEGLTTHAGSIALNDAPPADHDAPVVARLRAAGAIIVGSTNMVEFALGGLGLNTHYGTPRNPWERDVGRAPGGSSSGAAVSVADGMAAAALGTDTAGAVRMPAAACGLTGLKPTARRIPLDGIVPLSRSLDSVGPLAATVDCCSIVDAIFAGEQTRPVDEIGLAGLRLAVPQTFVLDDMDETVSATFAGTLSRLSAAGARITDIPFTELARLPEINRGGGLPIAEGYAWHRELLAEKGDLYDPIVGQRFRSGAKVSAADYIELLDARAEMIEIANGVTAPFDAILMPTLPIVPPVIEELETDTELYLRENLLFIRNNGLVNFFDRCALTLPCHPEGEAPVGLMVMGETMGDRRLLAIGAAIERAIA